MSSHESTRKQIERLLIEIISDPKIEQRTSSVKNVLVLVDRLIREVKDEEERKIKEMIDEKKKAIKEEVMRAEAKQIMTSAVSGAIIERLEADIRTAITDKLTQFLLKKRLDIAILTRLDELITMEKSREKREPFLPSDDEILNLYAHLPREIMEKMPPQMAIAKCQQLVNQPVPLSLGELKKMRTEVYEALSELKRWKLDDFICLTDLEEITSLLAQTIDEALFKAGFPKFSRKLNNTKELTYYYVPVDRSCLSEIQKVENELEEKMKSIEEQEEEKIEEERKRKIKEIRNAELIERPY
jgi:hypothetical protein